MSFGVSYTIIHNSSPQPVFLSWFPTLFGVGIVVEANSRIRVSGNLIEQIAGFPDRREAMLADMRQGRVSVTVCGEAPQPYTELDENAIQPGPFGCEGVLMESSSSSSFTV